MDTSHVNPSALVALLDRHPAPDSRIASATGIAPGHLGDLKTGRRYGTDRDLRVRLAAAMGLPGPEAISCWCDDPSRHRQVRPVRKAA